MNDNIVHETSSVEFTELEHKKAKTPLILISELVGTFILVFGILLPGALGVNLAPEAHIWGSENFWNTLDAIFTSIAVKGLWVATLILVLVFMFRRWSVNLNPAVTLAEISLKNDTAALGVTKIVIQFVGAFAGVFAAAAVIGFTSTEAYMQLYTTGTWAAVDGGQSVLEVAKDGGYGLDVTYPMFKQINWDTISEGLSYSTTYLNGTEDAWSWIIFVLLEAALTFGLLASVFWGKKISHNVRPFVIWGIVWLLLIVGIRFDTIALNPARLIAPAVLEKVLMNSTDGLQFSSFYLIGELFAVALFHILVVRQRAKVEANVEPQKVEEFVSKEKTVEEKIVPVKNKKQKNAKVKVAIIEEEEEIELITIVEEKKKPVTKSQPKKTTTTKKTNNTASTAKQNKTTSNSNVKKATPAKKTTTTKAQPKKTAYKNVNFEDYTIQEIRIILKEEKIPFSSRDSKVELIEIANKNLK